MLVEICGNMCGICDAFVNKLLELSAHLHGYSFLKSSRRTGYPTRGSFLESHSNIQVPGRTRGSFLQFHSNIQVLGHSGRFGSASGRT